MHRAISLATAVLVCAPAAATEVIRLAPETRDAVLAAAAAGPERAPVLTPEQARSQSVLDRSLYPEFFTGSAGGVRDRRVHGEVSVFAGSGGLVGMAGTAVVPVGDSGMASISILQSRGGGFGGPWIGSPWVGGFGRPGNPWANPWAGGWGPGGGFGSGFSMGFASGDGVRGPR
jgi:hypothetical protein